MVNETVPESSGSRQEDISDEISILDLFLVIAAGKKLIIMLALLCGIAAGIVAFVQTETFKATATILSTQQSSSASAIMGQLGGLAGFVGQSLGINSTDTYIGILESRTVADEMIKRFELQEVYKSKKLSDARKALKTASEFKTSDSGMLNISVMDKDPQLAADMANAYVDILKNRNNELSVTEASQRRIFFEKQWDEVKNRLAEAEWDLKNFQEQRGVIRADSQAEAVIQSIVRLQAEITAIETNLERLKTGATKQNPNVQQQEAALAKLRAERQRLESQNAESSRNALLMPTSVMPEVGLEYTRKLREVRYREALYEVMARQYESARLDEAKESPLILVVDDAVPPERKFAPNKRLYILIGLILGGMAGVFIVFLRHAASDPSQADKIAELKNLLSFGLLKTSNKKK